jgi:hypothetical protein
MGNSKALARRNHLEGEFTFQLKVPLPITHKIWSAWTAYDTAPRGKGGIKQLRAWEACLDRELARLILSHRREETSPWQ